MKWPKLPLIHRARYSLERLLLAGVFFRLMVLGGFLVIVAFLGGSLVWQLSPHPDKDFGATIWWAFLQMTDPGYLGDEDDTIRRVVYTLMVMLGLAIFVGAVVATFTQWLNQKIRLLELGMTPVPWRGHILVVGWTTRTPYLVKELLLAGDRIQKYLLGMSLRRLRICILAEEVKPDMVEAINREVGIFPRSTSVVLRSGDPLDVNQLDRGGFRRAGIMLLPADRFSRDEADQDARSIAVAMTIGSHLEEVEHKPVLVAEMQNPRRTELLSSLYPGQSVAVSADDILAALTVQCVAQPGISHLLYAILHQGTGFGIYLRKDHPFAGWTARDADAALPTATLVGLMHKEKGGKVRVHCPNTVERIEEDQYLILLSKSSSHLQDRILSAPTTRFEKNPPKATSRPDIGRGILLAGWNRRTPELIQTLIESGLARVPILNMSSVDKTMRINACAESEIDISKVEFIQQEPTQPGHWTEYGDELQVVIIQASDRFAEANSADANTLSILAVARGANHRFWARRYIVELLELSPDVLSGMPNVESLPTSQFMAHMLAHAAITPELVHVYQQLFDPNYFRLKRMTVGEVIGKGSFQMKQVIEVMRPREERLIAVSASDGSRFRLALEGDRSVLKEKDVILALLPLEGSVGNG